MDSAASSSPPGIARPAPAVLGLALLVNTLIAAFLTLAAPRLGGFGRNLLFSHATGLSVIGWALAVRALPAVRRLPMPWGAVATLSPAVPLGVMTGYALAYTVLGEPVRLFSLGPGRMAGLLATVLGTGFFGYVAWMRYRLALEATARARAQQLATEAELRLLRAQIEPHMLFNTLANLRSLVDDDPALAKSMLDQLIVYLRAALAASRTEWTTLRQEFAQLRAYLDIMSVRLGRRLRFELVMPDALGEARVPPMLLQPLVENALKHGIEPKVGGGAIEVRASRSADGAMVDIVVADTGLGLELAGGAPASASRFGLEHVRERLRTVYGARASLELGANAPRGARAVVRIPG